MQEKRVHLCIRTVLSFPHLSSSGRLVMEGGSGFFCFPSSSDSLSELSEELELSDDEDEDDDDELPVKMEGDFK